MEFIKKRIVTITIFIGLLCTGACQAIPPLSKRTQSLREALSCVTKMQIRSNLDTFRGKVLLEIDDSDTIAMLVKNIYVSDPIVIGISEDGHQIVKTSSCGCSGTHMFEFYRDSKIVVCFSLHHGTRLRWYYGKWSGDGPLTKDSRNFLLEWLAEHGINEPKQEYEESIRQAK